MKKKFIKHLYEKFDLEKREIDLILCHALNINTAGLFIFDKEIPESQQKDIIQLLHKRENGIPFAYITGYKEFWSLELKVNEHTLIPRPETEHIIELLLQWTNQNFAGHVLDLGTGTGAIALNFAYERPSAQVTAVDFSKECVAVARFNQQKYKLSNVDIFQSDWFLNIKQKTFDFIVSNPPYIAENDEHMQKLKYEPKTALTAKENGLADLFHIINHAKYHLTNNGIILLEHGFNQHHEVQKHLKQNHYHNIKTHRDLAGLPRITTAQLLTSSIQ